jgi:hypothetical protein
MPDQQIQKGTTYADGNSVSADNLNAHVDNAILLPGAITAQTDAATLNQADSLLMLQGGTLRKGTVSQMKTAMSLGDYIKRDGTAGLTTGQLSLYNTNQLANLDAVSLGYLNANFLKNSSQLQTLTGSLALTDYLTAANEITVGSTTNKLVDLTTAGISMLTTNQIMMLKRNPVEALEAVPKQYVDAISPRCKAQFNGRRASTQVLTGSYNATTTFVTFTTSSAHGFLVGHKFTAELVRVTGTAPLITTLFQVSSITDATTFNAVPAIAPVVSTGTITAIRKCVINNQSGTNPIVNIIYLGAADSGSYAVNLTNDSNINELCPIVTASALNTPETFSTFTNFGYTILFDYLETGTNQVPRNNTYNGSSDLTNSFVFTAVNAYPTTYDLGSRSSIVIY